MAAHLWRGVIEEYKSRLPINAKTPIVTLGEGGTPLVYACTLSEMLNNQVYLKVEGANPTGSFKDRGMTVAISKAAEVGAKAVICASTGNTSAAATAYADKAGMKSAVLIPDGKIAMGKLAQELADKYPVALVNSVNPDRIEGQKTASFEIVDRLGDAPDLHVLPVGNAGNITAYWKGYVEYKNDSISTKLPQMWGYQAAGAAPIVDGAPVLKPETIATAIRIGNPASWKQAIAARDESKGRIGKVTDEQILQAYHLLAEKEGVFVEPSSAAGVAGLIQAKANNDLPSGKVIVITVTGNGLKDPQWALEGAKETVKISVNADAAAEALGLK